MEWLGGLPHRPATCIAILNTASCSNDTTPMRPSSNSPLPRRIDANSSAWFTPVALPLLCVQLKLGDTKAFSGIAASPVSASLTISTSPSAAVHLSSVLMPSTKHKSSYPTSVADTKSKNVPFSIKNSSVFQGSPTGHTSIGEASVAAAHPDSATHFSANPPKVPIFSLALFWISVVSSLPLAPTLPMKMPSHNTEAFPAIVSVSSSKSAPVLVVAKFAVISAPLANHSANKVVSPNAAEATIAPSALTASSAHMILWIFFIWIDIPFPRRGLVEPHSRLESVGPSTRAWSESAGSNPGCTDRGFRAAERT